MRRILVSLVLVTVVLNAPAAQSQTGDTSGVWLATNVPYAPWTFDFKQAGEALTGRVWQNGAVRTVGEIMDAKVNGDLVSFNISGPLDGASRGVVTFTGTRSGDTIVFSRTTERSGGIGNGLYGTGPSAPKQVTARRQPTGTVAMPPGPSTLPQQSTLATAPTAATTVTGGLRYVAASGVAFAPWTINLKIENGTVTGNATQGQSDPASGYMTTLVGPFEIYDGKADGDRISFKLRTPDGGRVITFTGTRNGDRIAFTRSAEVLGDDPGRDGILGANGATQFTALLDSNPGTAPSTSAPPVRATTAAPESADLPITGAPSWGRASGRWQVMDVPGAPWIFDLTENGAALSGTVQQTGDPSAGVTIAAGKVNGSMISFKVLSLDGERILTFHGEVNGNEISFIREITVLDGGSRGRNGLYGGATALGFVAKRAAQPSQLPGH